tara:strand:- start:161 stop:790 length:630 start_codon:yes stop_codon:yes gene_type:complete
MVGAEMPSNSDLIKWAEQGRLHTKYITCTSATAAGAANDVWTIPAAQQTGGPQPPASSQPVGGITAIRVGQTLMISDETAGSILSNKAIVTAVNAVTGAVSVAYYEAAGKAMAVGATCTIFIYGSEFQKGTAGMAGSIEAQDLIFQNSPIIIKDTYNVSGSDMAQIGWVEVTTENGGSGYLWYLKSEHETRLVLKTILRLQWLKQFQQQ